MYKHITNISFGKASRGWVCQIDFRVQTRRQCTMECHAVNGYGWKNGFGILAILYSIYDALKKSRKEYKYLQTLPGNFQI